MTRGRERRGLNAVGTAIAGSRQTLNNAVPHLVLVGVVPHAIKHLRKRPQAHRGLRRHKLILDRQARERAGAHVVGMHRLAAPGALLRFSRQTEFSRSRPNRFIGKNAGPERYSARARLPEHGCRSLRTAREAKGKHACR